MTLDALRMRPTAAIAGVALLTAALGAGSLWYATSRHAAAAPVTIVEPAPVVIEHMTIVVPARVDPHMAIVAPDRVDAGMALVPPPGACVPNRAGWRVAVAPPAFSVWTSLVAAGAPLWFANLADDVVSGLLAQPTAPTT